MKRKKLDNQESIGRKIRVYLLISGIILAVIAIVGWNHFGERTVTVTSEIIQAPIENFQDQLDPSLVCMVNDAFMGKPQIPVSVNGKTYYGCCQGCVDRLNNDENARMAIDPFSGKRVDKSEAYIVLINQQGIVAYFESEENAKKYVKE